MQNKFKILWVILALLGVDRSFSGAANPLPEHFSLLTTTGLFTVQPYEGMTVRDMLRQIGQHHKVLYVAVRGGEERIPNNTRVDWPLIRRFINTSVVLLDKPRKSRKPYVPPPPK